MKWKKQVHGKAGSESFEISVVNTAKIDSAQKFYGWFDKNKLLISHNGGPCSWPVIPEVWKRLIKVADQVVNKLNKQK